MSRNQPPWVRPEKLPELILVELAVGPVGQQVPALGLEPGSEPVNPEHPTGRQGGRHRPGGGLEPRRGRSFRRTGGGQGVIQREPDIHLSEQAPEPVQADPPGQINRQAVLQTGLHQVAEGLRVHR